MKKPYLFLLLTLIISFSLISAAALADSHTTICTGNCGNNATWEVWDNEDGIRTLDVSGTGAVSPFYPDIFDQYIEHIIIHEGITAINDGVFSSHVFCFATEISLPASCISIGSDNFYTYDTLRTLTLSEGLQSIGDYSFFSPHAYCVAIIPNSVTQFGEGSLSGLIPAVYPGSTAKSYCENNEINYILLNSSGINSHKMDMLKTIAQVEDVPLRYRSQAASILQSLNLTDVQCDTLRAYVLDEEQKLKAAMIDDNMSLNEISGFLQRFISMMNRISVNISYEIGIINGFLGVHLTATVNSKETKVDIYRTGMSWYVRNITPSENNDYLYLETEDGIIITGYSGNEKDLQIPASINNIPVVSIENVNNGFPYGITSLSVPEGIKTIGFRAFNDQDQIGFLYLPDSLQTIGDSAFSGCVNLTVIDTPSGMHTDDNYYGIQNLPKSLEKIGNNAFYDCSSLTGFLEIPYGVSIIGNNAFSYCSGLDCIILPDSITSIGYGAFRRCSGLRAFRLPDGVTTINSSTFENCSSLTSITIPVSVNRIEWYAFNNCSSLEEICYFGTKEEWNAIFIDDYNDPLLNASLQVLILPDLILPDNLTVIDSEAFTGLQEGLVVFIPETVVSIAEDAFDNTVIILTPAGSNAAEWAERHSIEYYVPWYLY